MNVDGKPWRTIWPEEDGTGVGIIDQTRLRTVGDAAHAISAMQVRGAPLIGATAAYGLALALREDASDAGLKTAGEQLMATRPTAVNLRWAIEDVSGHVAALDPSDRAEAAWRRAAEICDEDVEICRAIGEHGLGLIRRAWEAAGCDRPVQIMTHCNAGWLATVDWGTATAPIYRAHEEGIPVHVWVDETRPRNQGAGLTAWELGGHGVPHTVIVDNAGGHVMQQGNATRSVHI